MIDFNDAELQGSGAGVIPPGSIVPLVLTIREPSAEKQGSLPLLCISGKGNEYLDIEFEVAGGSTFAGKKIWQNFTIAGSDRAAAISMRTLRAIVESTRGISPKDASPQATKNRQISDWADLNGMTFLAKVKCEVEQGFKDGRWYVNNAIQLVITPDMDEYVAGEHITDNPIPTTPNDAAPDTAVAATQAQPAWGASAKPAATQSAPHPAEQLAAAPAGNVPAWAKR